MQFEAERQRPARVQPHGLGRPADVPRTLVVAGLVEKAHDHELGHEARHGRLVQAGAGRDACSRQRAVRGDVAQHDPEVRPPDGVLVRAPGTALIGDLMKAHRRRR
jgi:hypothetical protein